MLREEDKQSGTLAQSDLSLILSHSLTTIQKDIEARRETVHDQGRSTSHKQVICRKSVLDRKATPDIALETYHSPTAVDRYLGDFERVRFWGRGGIHNTNE
jgi:hypothetical protein